MGQLLIGTSSPTDVLLGEDYCTRIYLDGTIVWERADDVKFNGGTQDPLVWSFKRFSGSSTYTSTDLHIYSTSVSNSSFKTIPFSIPKWAHYMNVTVYRSTSSNMKIGFGLVPSDLDFTMNSNGIATTDGSIAKGQVTPVANPGSKYSIDISDARRDITYLMYVGVGFSTSTRMDVYYTHVSLSAYKPADSTLL